MHIIIETRDQYGRRVAHPVCRKARIFAGIAGTKTLTVFTLLAIRELGYDITEKGH